MLISGPLGDCLDEVKDQKIRQKLQMAARNVDRLARLVDSLMDFSRLEAGRLEGWPITIGTGISHHLSYRPILPRFIWPLCSRVGIGIPLGDRESIPRGERARLL